VAQELPWTPLGDALWAKTARPPPETPPLDGDATADVAIVGAGYCGLSTALHLAEAGTRVVVLEAYEPGWGASGRNAGHCTPDWTYFAPDEVTARFGPDYGERLNDFQAGAAGYVFDLARRHGIDCDARQSGTISVVRKGSDAGLAACRAKAEQWQRRGKKVDLLDADAVAKHVGSERFQSAILFREGGNLQPLDFARGLARAAIGVGAAIHGSTAVTGIEKEGRMWRLSVAAGAVVRAPAVLLATNAHRSNLWPGLDRSYYPVASILGATAPLSGDLHKRVLPHGHSFAELGAGFFFFFDAGGRLVVGGGRGLGVNDTRERAAAWLGRRLNGAFPYLGPLRFDHYWAGWIDHSPNRMPGLHELAPGLIAAVGFSGRGVPTATAMGREIAQFLNSGDATSIAFPVTPLPRARFNRLGQWAAANIIIPLERLRARVD